MNKPKIYSFFYLIIHSTNLKIYIWKVALSTVKGPHTEQLYYCNSLES